MMIKDNIYSPPCSMPTFNFGSVRAFDNYNGDIIYDVIPLLFITHEPKKKNPQTV